MKSRFENLTGDLLYNEYDLLSSHIWSQLNARPVTGPYRRHMTLGRGVCCIQTGISEFKSLYRAFSTVSDRP